jgi:hypothetical protein
VKAAEEEKKHTKVIELTDELDLLSQTAPAEMSSDEGEQIEDEDGDATAESVGQRRRGRPKGSRKPVHRKLERVELSPQEQEDL